MSGPGSPLALGARVTLEELDANPHAVNARLRPREPVSWLPCLDGWLVTRHDLALQVMRDAVTFTVDDPRFSTGQVIGPSMLSLDGDAHAAHRAPFVGPFRAAAVTGRFEQLATEQARQCVATLVPARGPRRAELRRGFAGPMAAAIVMRALGLAEDETEAVLGYYEAIVASVTRITAGNGPSAAGTDAHAQLRTRLQRVIDGDGDSLLAAAAREGASVPGPPPTGLTHDQIASNAAVLLFGGIETTEGMIANAMLELLRRPALLTSVRDGSIDLDAVIDESLRLEPAAAVIDRYATADTTLGDARIQRGALVRISLAGANRDPAVFPRPDVFDPARPNLRRHLAFAQGPHVCVGVHLARLEARAALRTLLDELPGLRLDPDRPTHVGGLVFRKPVSLHVMWDTSRAPSLDPLADVSR